LTDGAVLGTQTTVRSSVLHALALALVVCGGPPPAARAEPPPADVQRIAEEAFVYGFPMVMNYAVLYDYFVDRSGPDFKAPFNQLYNTARVYTPKDTTIVTPNSDTPYSFVGMDLRAEPFVICNPNMEPFRYFSVQLIDLYTFNFGYIGTRTTGNKAGCHMVAGPGWTGETPTGIGKVFRSDTDLALALIRTQLLSRKDLSNVERVQSGYRAMPLSAFLNTSPPSVAPPVAWPKIDKQSAAADPFAYLNFLLQFAPATGPAAVERPMRERFAQIGIEAGKPFPPAGMTPERKAAIEAGATSGLETIKRTLSTLGKDENGWRVVTNAFGDRQMLGGNYAVRAAAAMAGIYGNDAAEALYPLLSVDSDGQKLDTATNRYTLTFPAGQLPPANAFWSVTMYDGKTQLLIENPINRYLINSTMVPLLKTDPDGSVTLHIQKDSPGPDKEANWLPAPDGPPYIVMRIYSPKPAALTGAWKPPAVRRVP
jgi:hypothetical protein